MKSLRSTLALCTLALLPIFTAHVVRADSVAQIGTGVRISHATAVLIDPQGRPGGSGMGTDTTARPGDILTFVVSFTPVPNGGYRGLGGYVTVYVPRNTEVVAARLIDRNGRTIAPHRAGLAADGAGPRGALTGGGSLAQLYADTGIFYSTDARTARVPWDATPAGKFITVQNGILLNPAPTAAGMLEPLLGATNDFAHNQWDAIQAYGFGSSGAMFSRNGQGSTIDFYGSPVAGPLTWYNKEASYSGNLALGITQANVVITNTTGPWNRIRTLGAETGHRGVAPPVPNPGTTTRNGIPAVDGTGTPLGVLLTPSAPLPKYDSMSPSTPFTNAVRFAVGELVVGEPYLSEISVRVLATPLDPITNSDTLCAEVFGGDASAERLDGTKDGKDNAWRYFLPAPSCVSLNLLFDIDVDKLVTLQNGILTYTISGKNLSTNTHSNVSIRQCYDSDAQFQTATGTHTNGAGNNCPNPAAESDVTWTIPTLAPGAEFSFTTTFKATGNSSTISRAVFSSDQLPNPGFQTTAFTAIGAIGHPVFSMTASPTSVSSLPSNVHYVATLANDGTGALNGTGCGNGAEVCRFVVTVPTGFTIVPGSATINGAAVANPTVLGNQLTFGSGLVNIAPGASATLAFDLAVAAGTASGAYTVTFDSWMRDATQGQNVVDSWSQLAEILVNATRSGVPTISGNPASGNTMIVGTTTEAAGTTIRVYANGVVIGMGTSLAGGAWSVTVPALYAGQGISVTAQASGELESTPSPEIAVVGAAIGAACSDGLDNDNDTFIDFPADPDCSSAGDVDEAKTPRCADGIDNDGDLLADFGSDPGCSSLLDDDETGAAECSDGMDNDLNNLTDFPADPGCTSATDVSERAVPACADGVDNDGDLRIDFPLDPGCTSALDNDETSSVSMMDGGVDGGTSTDGGVSDASVGDASASDAGNGVDAHVTPPDLGGVERPRASTGCGCSVEPASATTPIAAMLAVLAWVIVRARRRLVRVARRG